MTEKTDDLKLQLKNVRRVRAICAVGAVLWLIAVIMGPHPLRAAAFGASAIATALFTARMHRLEDMIRRDAR